MPSAPSVPLRLKKRSLTVIESKYYLYSSDGKGVEREVDQDEEDYRLLIEFVNETRKLIKQYPGLEHRNLHIGRVWDKFYYLLSQGRRNCEEVAESDWVKKAIFGGSPLNEASQTVIGSRIHYLDPSEVHNNLGYFNKSETETLVLFELVKNYSIVDLCCCKL
jgi:hypothetical protein